MATILAISSQVVRGSVGLSVIMPALHTLGAAVMALPTILLSNHPGHGHFTAHRTEVALLERLVGALQANGWLAGVDTILSGYLPTQDHVTFVAETVALVRQLNPSCRYICDPVLGDDPKGLYIDADTAACMRRQLVPLADIALPNRFELEWLSEAPVTSPLEAITAARRLSAHTIIATSIPFGDAKLATLHIDHDQARYCLVAHRAHVPNGTGDLLSGLIAGGWSLGRAVAAVDVVIAASAGCDELQLAPLRNLFNSQPLIETPLHVAS